VAVVMVLELVVLLVDNQRNLICQINNQIPKIHISTWANKLLTTSQTTVVV